MRIQPRLNDTGFTTSAGVWTVLVAAPGSAKSPMISAATEPLDKLDREAVRAHAAGLQRLEAKKALRGNSAPERPLRRTRPTTLRLNSHHRGAA